MPEAKMKMGKLPKQNEYEEFAELRSTIIICMVVSCVCVFRTFNSNLFSSSIAVIIKRNENEYKNIRKIWEKYLWKIVWKKR